jgi:GT2 family glycosyltransferase
MKATDITVGIVNYNTRDLLANCLQSVAGQGARIVVFDNNSSDGSAEMLEREGPSVTVIAHHRNVGYGAGLNRVAEMANTRYLLFLNTDTIVLPGGLAKLQTYMDRNPRAALAGPRLMHADGELQRSCRQFPGTLKWLVDTPSIAPIAGLFPMLRRSLLQSFPHNCPRVVPWVVGAAMIARADAFRAVGGFDEEYFMYCEEIDLCWRLHKANWEIHFTPVTSIYHFGGGSSPEGDSRFVQMLSQSMLRLHSKGYASRYSPAQLAFRWRAKALRRRARALGSGLD